MTKARASIGHDRRLDPHAPRSERTLRVGQIGTPRGEDAQHSRRRAAFWLRVGAALALAAVLPYLLVALDENTAHGAWGIPSGLGLPLALPVGLAGIALFPARLRSRLIAMLLYLPGMTAALAFWSGAYGCLVFNACV